MTTHHRLRPTVASATLVATLVAGMIGALAAAAPSRAAEYVPNEVVVGTLPGPYAPVAAGIERHMGARATAAANAPADAQAGATATSADPTATVLTLPNGTPVTTAIRRLAHQPGVAYAVPNYIAHADGNRGWIPNDPGRARGAHARAGWERLQWNFLDGTGVDAPLAWEHLIRDHRPGGRGVTIAVLDTGAAYRNWRNFRREPDFTRTRFVHPYDFVAHNRFPLDRDGHGTFVTGILAESTNNRIGLTGLAYGASIMPVRVLNATGSGDAATIAKGIRYAVVHHAQVINLSLEFTPDITAGDIPGIVSAIRFAARRGVVVVAASGNDFAGQIAYPARVPSVISVGATTKDVCAASYSNAGPGLSVVAPGGGRDKALAGDPNCDPSRSLPPIFSMTFANPIHPDRFSIPTDMYGTSMSTPAVSGTAALIIASRVLGRHPTPDQIRQQLERTARPLGAERPNVDYGFGLVDAGAATARPGQRTQPT